VDHAQAANEVKRKSGAKIYSHWIEARYLGQNPPYLGPPSAQETVKKLEKLGVSMGALIKEYGSLDVDPISVDEQLSDGDMIRSLKVIHTPGHTPGHISLYYEKDKFLLGADSIYKHIWSRGYVYICTSSIDRSSYSNSVCTETI
jgi:glyoxylase-like metal-dependent hydrolase (beta-lactamase superfamily II)